MNLFIRVDFNSFFSAMLLLKRVVKSKLKTKEICGKVFKFSSSQSLKVLEWVLSQGANARPRAPEEFVERWKKEIHALNRLI